MTYKELLNSFEATGVARKLSDEELVELKKIMLSCYRDVDLVCKKYNLALMLGGGSCLGAVRHKGFIPWDDDFDLLMLRDDYDKFEKIFESELGDKYVLNAPNYCSNPSNRFPKILVKGTKFVEIGGRHVDTEKIKVDIFILENVPHCRLLRIVKGIICYVLMYVASCVDIYECRKDALYTHLMSCKNGRKLLRSRLIVGCLFSFRSYSKWCNVVDKNCQYGKKTDLLGIPTGRKHYFGEIYAVDSILPVSKGIFEGYEVHLPNNADAYLSSLYGDYMSIPPEDKREKHLIEDISFKIN